jgi:hypothetical protein
MSWLKEASKTKAMAPVFETAGTMQQMWQTELGDYQRWVVDAYTATAYLTTTKYKIVVSISINKLHLGTIMLQMFWKYDLSEKSRAKETFEKVKKALTKIFNELSDQEAPSSLYESMIRHDCGKIDREKIAPTTVPTVNYKNRYDYERDWRTSIYGNRYPKPTELNGY